MRVACCRHNREKARKVKNVMEGLLGEKVGRLHLKRQDLDNMGTRKVSALRKRKGASGDEQPYKKKN
jgi:ribosome production factor 2